MNFKRRENFDKMECYSCGRLGHKSRDPNCKASSAKCYNCNQIGHFSTKCRKIRFKSNDVRNLKRSRENIDLKDEVQQKKMRSYGVFDEMQLEIEKSDIKTNLLLKKLPGNHQRN